MNHEYLWSKTGTDAEVERLEGLLAEFRYDRNSEPGLHATKIVPAATISKRRPFVFALSFAVSAAAVIMVAIWATRTPIAPVATFKRNIESIPEAVVSRMNDGADSRMAERSKNAVSRPGATYLSSTKPHRSNADRGPNQSKVATKNLTKEEKYAYDRLMFALSIAGSKLKVVQDTIDRKGEAGQQSIRNEK